MKTPSKFLPWFLIVVGVIWILQGINILPGSFMTGQIGWAYAGAVSLLIGWRILSVNKSSS